MITVARPDLLEAIVAATTRSVAIRAQREPIAALASRAETRQARGDLFKAAISDANRVNVIAECKRRSPSRGVLRPAYDPVAIARSFENAGAVAVSVLTEPTFFDGSLQHLSSVRAAVKIPLLRKDFVVDEYQLLEAVVNGADAVLLIVAALDAARLKSLREAAVRLGLATLIEVHDIGELERALAAGADIIGVNNRNLRTLEVDTRASDAIAEQLPPDVIAVSESGLKTADDLHRLRELGYHAFLIGERFMTTTDPGATLAEMLA